MRIKTFTLSIFSIVIILAVLLISSIGFADTEVRGFVAQDTHWTLDKSPYVATGSLIVKQGVTLTIEPGVTVKFKPNTALQVDGALIARGTEENPITFTAYEGTDSGSWGYILFIDSSTPTKLDDSGNYLQGSVLEYCLIQYAGGISDMNATLRTSASNLLVDHCTISYSAGKGVIVNSGKAVIRNSSVSSNKADGIFVDKGIATIISNIIKGNGGSGIYVNATAAIMNNTITGNTASQGAAAWLNYNIPTFSGNSVTDNDGSSGTIYIKSVPKQFKNNAIYNNRTNFDIYYDVAKGTDMDATNNYWETTDEREIRKRIYDSFVDASKGIVNFVPFLTAPGSGPFEDPARYVNGFVSQDTRWTVEKSPYIVIGSLVVNQGATLTIEPGVTMKFTSSTALQIDGALIARGTEEKPIFFTALESSNPGSWGYILFTGKSTPTEMDKEGNYLQGSILEYCLIQYAGGTSNIKATLSTGASNLLVDHCTISHSASRGVVVSGGQAIIRNSTISDNRGGGIETRTTITITDNTITGNPASDGGGIYVNSATHPVAITDNTITGNTASNNGGGIYVERSFMGAATISNNTITRNSASNGGGIYVKDWSETNITNNTITGNTASNGGGIYVKGGAATEVTITKNTITGNTASQGVAASLGGGIKDLSSNIITDNKKSSNATNVGVIYLPSLARNFKNNSLYSNQTDFDIYYNVARGTDMDATGNYWGTTDEATIEARIYDFFDDASKGVVNFIPFLTAPPGGPSTPTGLVLTVLGASSVQLTWNANPEPDMAGYKLYYDTDAGAPYEGKGAKEGDSPIDVKKVTSYTLSGLQTDTTYYFVVIAYATGKESGYSNEVRSNSPPQTPSNDRPADKATDIPLTPTLESSAFSDPEKDSHKASQWQITTTAGDYANPVYDSGGDTNNKTKITIPKGKLILNTTYYWRVRHQDNRGNWSDYSKETRFTTISEGPPTPPGIYQSKLSLTKGINIISLSLKPETPWTAKTIVQELGATIVIRAVDSNFEAYVAEGGIGEDFPIEANKGYIVNVTEPVNYTLLGKPWGDPVAAPSIETENPTWAFVVTGTIEPNIAEIARIVNFRTGASTIAKIQPNGRFIAVFCALSRRSVVEVDDAIELSFIDKHGNLLSKVIRRIESEQIERAYLNTLIELRPVKTALFQNYPNPFNPETWIPYQIAQDAQVRIEIFNVAGKLIRRIELGNQTAGWYVTKARAAYWNGCNETGEVVSSGIYFYKLRAGNYSAVRKLLIVK